MLRLASLKTLSRLDSRIDAQGEVLAPALW